MIFETYEFEIFSIHVRKKITFEITTRFIFFVSGVKAESKPIVLEPKPMPYLQHLHSNSSAHNVNSLNAENNNLEHSVISEEDTKDPLSASIQAQDQATEVSVATNLINQEQSQQNHVNFFPERNY